MQTASASPEAPPLRLSPPAPTEREATPRWDPYRWVAGALVAATIATRLPFMTQTLYAFDSANYALAVRDFYNVAFHQPHPPGYPLYVFFARVINLATNDANRALVIEGVLWSAIAVACTIALGRAMFGRTAGLLSGALLLCTVGFWGYGEVAYPYVALAGETAALALLTHRMIERRRGFVLPLAVVWAISLGVRWDAAVFCIPITAWAFSTVTWRLRALSLGVAAAIIVAWAVPMIVLTGGWDTYRQALSDYLHVWSPQSAFVLGDYASGGDTQATYNLNFLVNYLRQMLGIGLILVVYLFGRRFALGVLAADYRSRFLALWTVPPLLVYVFAHLGEPGYVLSLAPQSAILIAIAILDLRDESATVASVFRARHWHWVPSARIVAVITSSVLTLAILGWNIQAFARGVGPGRLPDLRAHDATTSAQVDFIRQQPVGSTLVLAHDIFRQLHYYVPEYRSELLFSEYVPDFQTALTTTDVPPSTSEIVVLDSPLKFPSDQADRFQQLVLHETPQVTAWLVNAAGAHAVEHGYQYMRLML